MEFVRPPRRSPRFPHPTPSSSSSPSSSLATHATATISGAAGLSPTHNHNLTLTNTNTHPHHPSNGHRTQSQDPIPTTTIPTNKKRPRLTLDLPDIPNIPAGLSPRDIRALKRRKLLHPTSAPPSPTALLSSLPSLPVASSSSSPPHQSSSAQQGGSSPLTSPISATISNRSSTPPPPPSIPPLIQPTSANAVRGERRKKMAFESSPLSRSSTTPTTPTTPTLGTTLAMAGPSMGTSTRHSYALRSAPAQVKAGEEEMEVDDLKGKSKEKLESTGSKRRRKENSAVLANGPVLKRLRSNSTPASLTSLPSSTRSRRGILRPAPTSTTSPSPAPLTALGKGKGKAVEFDLDLPSTSMDDEASPRLEKRPSIRSLRSNSTVTTEMALPLPSRRVRASNTPNTTSHNDESSSSPTGKATLSQANGKARGRGRGRGGRAAIRGRGRGRKRVDVIEASPKVEASDGVERDEGDVEAMELTESPKDEAQIAPLPASTPTVKDGPTRPSTPEPQPAVVAEAAPLVNEVEPTVVAVASPVVEVEASLSPLSPLSSEPPTPLTPSTATPSSLPSSDVPATSDGAALAATAGEAGEESGGAAAAVTAPTPQRPPLRLRIPGEEAPELTTTTVGGQGWESYLGDVQVPQQQQVPQQEVSFEHQGEGVQQQMISEPTGISIPMSLDPSSSNQQQHHEQISYPHSTEQPTYGGGGQESGYDTDGFTLDQAYQEQLAQQQQSMGDQSMQQQQQMQMGGMGGGGQGGMGGQQMQQVQQVQRRQTAPGLWEVACKIRVCELERRYSWITIRDLVTQEATEYAMRHGIPRSWWRVTHPPPVAQMTEEGSLTPTLVPLSHHSFSASTSASASTPSPSNEGVSPLTSTPTALNESSLGTNILPEMTLEEDSPEGEGEDWSDYESEFSDVDSEGRISRESSKGNSPVDLSTATAGEKGGVSPSGSPRRKRKAAGALTAAASTSTPTPIPTLVAVPLLPLASNGLDHLAPHPASTLPIPLDFAIGGDEGSKKRRRSWPGEFPSYEEDLGVDDFMDDEDEDEDDESDSDEEEDEDADAEGEIDPDAWHDPSFHVVAQPVDLEVEVDGEEGEESEDKENASLEAKEGGEKKKERRMKTPVVEVGGTMSAFYVPPLPPSPPMQTATLPASPPSQHQELGPGLDVLIGGEHSHHQHHQHQHHQHHQDVDMGSGGGSPRQETSELDHFSPTATDGSLSPTSPSSPISFHSPSYDPNVHPQTMENGADMFAQSSSVMSPTAYMPNMGMMYESTLPVPAPKLATIRVHALRSVEVGRVVVGKGTPVDRRRVMEWANAGSPSAAARGDLRAEDVEGDERMGFFRQVVNERKNPGGFSGQGAASSSSESGFGDNGSMTPLAHTHTHTPVTCSSGGGVTTASMNTAGFDPMWDAFLDQLKSNGEGSDGMSPQHHSTQMQSSILTSTLRSEPERPFEPAPPPLPPSPSTPMCTPPASPLSTNPLSSPACLGFSSPDAGMYYGANPGSTSPTSPVGSSYNGFPMGAPSMHINSAAAASAAADFGIGMFGVGFNMGVGVGVGIGIAVGAAGVASGMVNIPPPATSTQCPTSPTSPAPMGGWASPPPTTSTTMGEYDQQGQLQQGAFGMSMPGDIFGDHPGPYGGFGAGGSSTLSFALG